MKQSNNRTIKSSHFESLYPVETRFEEIAALVRFLKEGKSCQVLSLPGGGRSNFLGLLSYNHAIREKHLGDQQQWFHFVDIDFSQIRKQPLSETYKLIFLEIINSLQERELLEEYAVVKEHFKEALEFHDGLVLFQGLKKSIDFLCLEKKLTVVLLFDRFEEYLSMLTPEFFTNLRILQNHAKYRFSVVLSLPKALEEVVEPSLFMDFSDAISGNLLYLSLDDTVGLTFRIDYIEKVTGKTLNETQRAEILRLTGGHPKLTRICVEMALKEHNVILSETKDLTPEILKQVQDDKIDDKIKAALKDIWQVFNPAEQSHFLKDLFGKTYEDEHTKYLEAIGIIKDTTITIPLFETFVEEQKTAQTTPEVTAIQYVSETNSIVKGQIDLSEKLTATEFRLLRFFLENPGTILERNAIISGVWKENKTILGVTDQALDQLVFRLRRKIEEDPNNPTHLHTIKGRGFKFSP
ncbi:MAG: winged helix-turn-helix domain-containing protein [Candidatus Levybacteria bacterium]|nr:winged helix-turn-helix domain-containing protein [Candidatus Levybacteria bacterium]